MKYETLPIKLLLIRLSSKNHLARVDEVSSAVDLISDVAVAAVVAAAHDNTVVMKCSSYSKSD